MNRNEYTGGRQMMAHDLWDLTERDRAIIRYRELKEQKFLRESGTFESGAKRVVRDMFIGVLLIAFFLMIVLGAIMFKNAGV